MRRLSPHLAPAGYSPTRYAPLSPAPVSDQGQRLTDIQAIQRLFANGEQGGYWPADPAYLYEDSAGTIPASVNGVVGLRYDISRGMIRGENIINNGEFASGTGWYLGTDVTISDGVVRFNTTTNGSARQANTALITGNAYLVTVDIISISRGNPYCYAGVASSYFTPAIGRQSTVVIANGTTFYLYGGSAGVGGDAVMDNVSVQSLNSFCALQATTANKPYLRRTPVSGKYWLDSNTSTGALTATFASSLGSACTIATVGAEGVTIAENQTVGTTYNLCPYNASQLVRYRGDTLIINRALTLVEKALITRHFQRGVPSISSGAVI